MASSIDRALQSFRQNADAVERLLEFDHVVLDVAVTGLRELENQLESKNLHSALPLVRNRAALLENLKHADSLRPQYEAIFNQCVVLLVSYFSSAQHTLFRDAVVTALELSATVPAASEELKISWMAVIQAESDQAEMFAELLIAQHDISFQDMQSVSRAFAKHLQINVEKTLDVNDIILGHAARHVIAHTGGTIDHKMINQIKNATPRRLKEALAEGERIRFSPEEIRTLATSMRDHLAALTTTVERAVERWAVAKKYGDLI
jgi:hypothetical protein